MDVRARGRSYPFSGALCRLNSSMRNIDCIYINLLIIATVRLRNLISLREVNFACAEVEHLHLIPTLIGENVAYPHFFYFRVHRQRFIDSIERLGSSEQTREAHEAYSANWDRLQEELLKEFGTEPNDTKR